MYSDVKSNVKSPSTVTSVCPCQFLGALHSQLPNIIFCHYGYGSLTCKQNLNISLSFN